MIEYTIFCSILIIVFIGIIKDTKAIIYNGNKVKEYNSVLPLWQTLYIVIIMFVPFLNIAVFLFFINYYYLRKDSIIIIKLKGNNLVGKVILTIKKFLSIRI